MTREVDDWNGDDRRENGGLSDEQVRAIKEAILASIYEDIGRSIVKKVLWIGGTALLAVFAWLAGHGYVKLP